MKPIYSGAFLLLAATGSLWLLFTGLFFFAPAMNFRFYPATTVPIAAVTPLLFGAFTARHIAQGRKRPSATEWWIFRLIVLGGFAVAAFLTEAAIMYAALNQIDTYRFADILLAPLNERYTFSALFGLSFLASGMMIGAFLAIVTVPARVSANLRATQADGHTR